MFMCVVNLESVNKLDLTWKQSFLIFVKNHNIAKNSTTTKAREKISTELESLEFFYVELNFKKSIFT